MPATDWFDRVSPVRFGRAICGELPEAERREWWLANGRGAYAAGTVALSLTRRYHGLLIAPVDPPLGRVLVLAKADATLTIEGRQYPLFTNRWGGGAIVPPFSHAFQAIAACGVLVMKWCPTIVIGLLALWCPASAQAQEDIQKMSDEELAAVQLTPTSSKGSGTIPSNPGNATHRTCSGY